MSETHDRAQRTDGSRTIAVAAWAALVLFAIAAMIAAAHRGIWLDEIWSIYEGQHDLALRSVIADRWMTEISPPVFYFLSWAVTPLVGDDIFLRRAFNLVPLCLAAIAFAYLANRHPERRGFLALLALLLLSHPATMAQVAEHRAYFTMLAASSVLVAALTVMIAQDPVNREGDRALVGICFASLLAIFSMHYVVAFQIGIAAGVFIISLWIGGRRGRALSLAGAVFAAAIPAVILFVVQRRMLVGFAQTGWIHTPWYGGLVFVGALLLVSLTTALVVIAAMALRRGQAFRRDADRRGAFILAVAAAIALSALVAVNAVQPVIIERYLVPMIPFLLAPIALLGARIIAADRLLLIATVTVAGASILLNARSVASESRWDGAAGIIADAQSGCQGTVVHAMPHWKFVERPLVVGPQELEVMQLGINSEARKFGLRVEPETSRRLAGNCPTIVWVSHWYNPPITIEQIAERSTLPLSAAQVREGMLRDEGPWLVAIFPPKANP